SPHQKAVQACFGGEKLHSRWSLFVCRRALSSGITIDSKGSFARRITLKDVLILGDKVVQRLLWLWVLINLHSVENTINQCLKLSMRLIFVILVAKASNRRHGR